MGESGVRGANKSEIEESRRKSRNTGKRISRSVGVGDPHAVQVVVVTAGIVVDGVWVVMMMLLWMEGTRLAANNIRGSKE